MSSIDSSVLENLAAAAKRDGVLDFKDEGENGEGVSIGKLTLHSSTDPVFPDGRWVTRPQARRIAQYCRVELFEY